jgi:hypothetical protein
MDNCIHARTEKVSEPQDSMHHSAIVCLDCRKIIRYLPRISNLNKRRENAQKVERLLAIPTLSAINKGFLMALSLATGPDNRLKLSPKQQQALDQLVKENLP